MIGNFTVDYGAKKSPPSIRKRWTAVIFYLYTCFTYFTNTFSAFPP